MLNEQLAQRALVSLCSKEKARMIVEIIVKTEIWFMHDFLEEFKILVTIMKCL